MKKVLSVILAAAMLSGTNAVFADSDLESSVQMGTLTSGGGSGPVLPEVQGTIEYDSETGFYANKGMLTIPFTRDISGVTDENIAENVALMDTSGKAVTFTASADGNKLIITPDEDFLLDEIYIFSIKPDFGTAEGVFGKTQETAFKVRTVMQTDLSNETDITNVFKSANPAGGSGQQNKKYALYEGYAYTQGFCNMLYLQGEYANMENYTIEFPMKLFATRNNVAIAFNNQEQKMSDFASDTSFGWINDTSTSYHKPAYKMGDASYKTNGTADASVTPSFNSASVTWDGDDKITNVGNARSINYYRIDKTGAEASLYLKTSENDSYSLVDNFDTSELGDVPTTGYFGFGSKSRTASPVVAVGDILITQSIEVEIEEGEIALDEAVEPSYSTQKAVLTFDTDLTPVDMAEFEKFVTAADSEGNNVECSFAVNGKELSIIPETGFTPETEYTITVKAGLGFLKTRIKEDIVKTFTIATQPIHVVIESESDMQIDTKQFIIPFDADITGTSEETVKQYVTLSDSEGNEMEYSASVEGNILAIYPDEELVFNNKYSVSIKKGFGYSNKLLENDFQREFTVTTVPVEIDGSLYANVKRLTVPLNRELEGDIDYSAISVTDENSKLISCDFQLNGKNLEIIPQNGFERDIVYTVEIKSGFGSGVSRVTEDINKSFRIKTIIAPDFEKDDIDSYFAYGVGPECFNVKDGKLFYNFGVKSGEAWSNFAYLKSEEKYNTFNDYSVSFDVEYYGQARISIAFNSDNNTKNLVYPGSGMLTAFMWKTNQSAPAVQDIYCLNGSGVNGTNLYENSDVEVPGLIAAEPVTYNEDFTIANVPAGAQSYNYTIDKKGKVGYLFLDNVLVDTYDTQKAVDYWNEHYSEHSTSTATPVTYEAPSTGYFGIGANDLTGGTQTIAISNLQMTRFEEVNKSESIELRKVDTVYDGTTVNSEITVKNYYKEDKPVKIGVFVYGENEKLLGGQILGEEAVSANSTRDYTASIDAENAKKLRVVVWDNLNNKTLMCNPYTYDLVNSTVIAESPASEQGSGEAAKIKSVTVTNYDSDASTDYVISVKGNVAPSDKDRYITLTVLREDIEPQILAGTISEIEPAYGNASEILIKANHTEFTYNFEFDNDFAPAGEGYNYNVKAVGDGINLSSSFKYANEQDAVNFVNDKLSEVNITFEELNQYSTCLGIDVSEFDTESKQNVLIDALKRSKDEISKAEDTVEAVNAVIREASAKVIILRKIHTETVTAADVNTVLTTYAEAAKLDLTNYNKLSSSEKTSVCNALIGKDYETSGFDAFVEDFEKLIEDADDGDTGGGGSGGNPGSGGNGGTNGNNSNSNKNNGGPSGLTPTDVNQAVNDMKVPFTDLENYAWAEQYIRVLYNKGVITGVTEDRFAPGNNVTREQFAVMIVKAFNIPTDGVNADFNDVSKDRWSYKYIAAAKESGIMMGNDKGNFNPQSYITREDMAVVLYRASVNAGKVYSKTKTDYSDFDAISEYAKEAVSYLVGEEIINGFGDGTFRGKDYANRAQAAKLICLVTGGAK